MTNEQIVLSNRIFLMEEGLIKGLGRTIMFADENGVREVEEPEEIHTFNEWKKLGYIVKKGEHSIARFPIWKKSVKKGKKGEKEEEKESEDPEKDSSGRYYMKVSHFFVKDQVERIESDGDSREEREAD